MNMGLSIVAKGPTSAHRLIRDSEFGAHLGYHHEKGRSEERPANSRLVEDYVLAAMTGLGLESRTY